MVDSVLCSLFLLASLAHVYAHVYMNRTGCGDTKACLFRPAGCDPNLDCTTGVILYVVGENRLRIQMTAASIVPKVQQQYVAVAFSHDRIMGNDSVTECVMSDMGLLAGFEPEVFVSLNRGKSNDRVFLNTDEHQVLITDISSTVLDGRMMCQYTQQIVPQIDDKNGMIWDLNTDFYIMAATGSAQPDEVNAHDMTRGSLFYPITSTHKINPSKLTHKDYLLPDHVHSTTTTMKSRVNSSSVLSGFCVLLLSLCAWF